MCKQHVCIPRPLTGSVDYETRDHELMAKLKEQGSPVPGRASAEALERAQAAGFPDELLDLYRECEPENCIELKQRIWSIENAIIENSDAVPGCVLSPHGFIVLTGASQCLLGHTAMRLQRGG